MQTCLEGAWVNKMQGLKSIAAAKLRPMSNLTPNWSCRLLNGQPMSYQLSQQWVPDTEHWFKPR